jgi:hypothetical protein
VDTVHVCALAFAKTHARRSEEGGTTRAALSRLKASGASFCRGSFVMLGGLLVMLSSLLMMLGGLGPPMLYSGRRLGVLASFRPMRRCRCGMLGRCVGSERDAG